MGIFSRRFNLFDKVEMNVKMNQEKITFSTLPRNFILKLQKEETMEYDMSPMKGTVYYVHSI